MEFENSGAGVCLDLLFCGYLEKGTDNNLGKTLLVSGGLARFGDLDFLLFPIENIDYIVCPLVCFSRSSESSCIYCEYCEY